jgi:hypothetical protein
MRPLVFDFAQDARALDEAHSYMFGRAIHVHRYSPTARGSGPPTRQR